MTPAKKEKYSIRHGYDAMNRIEEAGELIGELLKRDDYHPGDAVDCAYMDFIMETIEIGHELRDRHSADTVKHWIEPKRDVLLAELQRRGVDQSPDARHALRKIEAVLAWVDDWPNQLKRFTEAPPILRHTELANWNDYAFDCPEGTWTGQLEQKAWGKSANLILCFVDTGHRPEVPAFSVQQRPLQAA